MRLRVSLLSLLLSVCLLADDPAAWELYEKGRDAEKAGHMAEAYLMYAQAAAMEPRNKTYWDRVQAVQSRAAMQARPEPKIPAVADLDKELNQPPDLVFDKPTAEDLAAAREPLPPTELDADRSIHDLDFTGDYKSLFRDVAHVYGLECTYDSDFQPGPNLQFHLHAVDYRDALHSLEAATGSFLVPLTPKLVLVAKDSPPKRIEIEPTATITVQMPNTTTPQEFQEIIRGVQTAMGIEKVGLDPSNNTLIMRDRISKVVYARALLEQLMQSRAEVGIEMRFLEITRNDAVTYGINFPSMFSLNALTTALHNQFSLASGLQGLLTFGGGKTLIGLGIASPALVAQMSHSTSKILLDANLRSQSGQKATLHIGQKYPIISGGYGTATSATGVGGVTPAPSFTFQDLGLTMTATPVVHDTEFVSLDVEASFQVLTGASVNGLPVISNRSIKNITYLKFGEWAILAGLMTTNEARTISGLAGLSRIPFLGPLTSTHEHDSDSDQVIVLLKPVLLTLPPGTSVPRGFRTGTENRPFIPL
jgi:type II secretory pathway component HofQ